MQNIIKEILIAQLSFPLKYKNEKEIWWENKLGEPITVEIIDIENERCIVRGYYGNWQLHYKANYRQGQLHGEYLEWYSNGQLYYKENYHQGQWHGKRSIWYSNGQLRHKAKYNYGKLINAEYY